MERRQGFFSSLKSEVVRGLSPSRSRSNIPPPPSVSPASGFLRRRKSPAQTSIYDDFYVPGLGGLRPVAEGPDPDGGESTTGESTKRVGRFMGQNVAAGNGGGGSKRSELRLLLGVMGAPLAPVHDEPLPCLSLKDTTPIETSSAQYILQQYAAACGGIKLLNSIRNAYAMGKLRMMMSEFETAMELVKKKNPSKSAESGGFVLWQMNPGMWYVELAISGIKVFAGCNKELVWRHTPWLGAHTPKGPVRPLRRALQGLDPRTIAMVFADSICTGEKSINGEDCFVLKLVADPKTLKSRSEGPAEIIRHVMFGHFSQRTGLLVHIEDSHLTRIQPNGGDSFYWETTTSSFLDDYQPVEGVMIAHAGRSVVTLFRFGETAMSHTKTKMEEAWTIEEVVFNIPGLSVDCFIPPSDLRSNFFVGEAPHEDKGKSVTSLPTSLAKVAHSENA